jgi:hypothetical protein
MAWHGIAPHGLPAQIKKWYKPEEKISVEDLPTETSFVALQE